MKPLLSLAVTLYKGRKNAETKMKFFLSILILIAAYFAAPYIVGYEENGLDTNTQNRLSEMNHYENPTVNHLNEVNGHSPP
jgi:hypothetical protein